MRNAVLKVHEQHQAVSTTFLVPISSRERGWCRSAATARAPRRADATASQQHLLSTPTVHLVTVMMCARPQRRACFP